MEEKRSGDREVWLKWLSRYSQRLYQELEPGTDVSKVVTNGKNVDCRNFQVLSEIIMMQLLELFLNSFILHAVLAVGWFSRFLQV